MTLAPSLDPSAPIGVFDSGLGGLTVVRCLREVLPHERIVYVADQTHVPYGGRELSEVCGFACSISAALLQYGCKALVMACNISSATALPGVQAEHPETPILGVILPGAQAAAAHTCNGRIGVLATAGTVKSGAYTRALHALHPALRVTEVACPAFVPLVESGEEETPHALVAAHEYVTPLRDANVDTIILGCTHYPFLLSVLRVALRGKPFIDPAEQTARELAALLTQHNLTAPPNAFAEETRPYLLATTGDPAAFAEQTRRFLPDAAEHAEFLAARWENGALQLK